MKRCFAAARWAYNWTVAAINGVDGVGEKPNFIALRNKLRLETDRPEVAKGVHNKILARAVKQACDAFQTNFKKMEHQGKGYKFRVQFRSFKKSLTETVIVEKGKEGPFGGFEPMPTPASSKRRDTARTECYARFGGNLRDLGRVRLQDSDEVVARMLSEGRYLQEDAKLQWDKRTDDFYFIYTYDCPVAADPDPTFASKRVLSADLGVSPPVQWYTPDGSHGQMLRTALDELPGRCEKLDALESRIARRATAQRPANYNRDGRKRRRTTRRLRHKLARDRRRLHNWVEAAHYDAANSLLQQADVLVVPRLPTGKLSERATRSIRSKTVRSMLTLSLGLFCDRLVSRAIHYPGRHVFTHTGEPGTSGTASCCGWWNPKLRVGMELCPCPHCNVVLDRQVNGARGNLLNAIGVAMGIGWDGASA